MSELGFEGSIGVFQVAKGSKGILERGKKMCRGSDLK